MQNITVEFGNRSYHIIIKAGSLPQVGSYVRKCTDKVSQKACVVTTETVAGLYLETALHSLSDAGFEITQVIVPDGEEYKTLTTYEEIITQLIKARFERKSVVIPLGGGVIGDVAGFVAATFLRGIPFVQVPTTIVAQVDSSIGGKVAVNHVLGKNLIGSFYQPRGVWIDTRVLSTLDHREVVSGMGEAIKHAMIRDRNFFAFLDNHLESIMKFKAPDNIMERFIAWNCRIKADIVSADEHESGLRTILNYGHTVGHALESITGYRRFKHGEAVMLGMIAAGRIALKRGLLSEADFDHQNNLLERAGINRDVGGIHPEKICEAMTRDKKVSGGRIRFVLPDDIGSVSVYDEVTENEIEDGITFMLDYAEL